MIIRNLILPAVLSATVGFAVLAAPDAAHATGYKMSFSKVDKDLGKKFKHSAQKKHKAIKKHGWGGPPPVVGPKPPVVVPPTPTAVPELNGSGLAASMFFLAGGALLLTGRRRIATTA